MDIKTKIQLEEKNFQHYIDLGVYDSEDIAGLEVWQIIDRIRKRCCDKSIKSSWWYSYWCRFNPI